jgi:hypothetical protein
LAFLLLSAIVIHMGQFIDLTGKKFGTLTIIAYAGKCRSGKSLWVGKCSCGNVNTYRTGNLQAGQAMTCRLCQNTTHGHTKSKEKVGTSRTYRTWDAMRARCYKPHNISYKYYGALGVQVCESWNNSFEAFLSDMGERPEGKTLDRIDPAGNYEPGNCRWATSKEQAINKRKIPPKV